MKLFSKNLTATDCLKRLSIPIRVLASLPQFHSGHAVKLRVRYGTVVWPLVCTVRKEGRYKKPVISMGWRKFVIVNGLKVGDRLTFHKEEKEEDDEDDDESSTSLHYRVELKRSTNPSRALDVDQTDIAISSIKDVGVKKLVSVAKYCMDQNAVVTDSQVVALSNGGGGGGGGVVDSSGQFSDCAREKTAAAVVEQFNLGLTVAGTSVRIHDHDQASRSTSFFKTHQRVGFDLDTILGQSMHENVVLNLNLTLGHQY